MPLPRLHHALGCWGITLGRVYRDVRFDKEDRTLHLFVNDLHASKSWYVLRRRGLRLYWHLLRREDCWGEYRAAGGIYDAPHRRPPLYEFPRKGVPQRAWELRNQFNPYQILEDWYGERLEVMSYPVPNAQTVSVMLRVPGDPTTLREEVLEQYFPPETQ